MDPCETDVLTIDPDDQLFKAPPEISLDLAINEPGQSISIVDGESVISTLVDMTVCGSIVKEFWDVTASGIESALDPKIFTQTDSISQAKLFIEADQIEQVGTYKLRLLVFYEDFPEVSDQKDFIVNIANLCSILSPATSLIE